MRKSIQLLIPMLLFAAPAQAQWTVDGVGVCTATGLQTTPVITSDDAGGCFVAWADGRAGGTDRDIYVQHLNAAGTPLWAANGVVVCNATNQQTRPRIVSDGAGRAIVTWQDQRSGNADIYAQRVNANGTMAWTANGVPVTTATGEQSDPEMMSDGAGGAFIAWTDYAAPNGDVYAQRVNTAGAALWTANGVPVATGIYGQWGPTMATDGAGGVIIAWNDGRYGTGDEYFIFAQRLNSAGVEQWTANGSVVSRTTGDQGLCRIVGDGSGGAVIVWKEYEIGVGYTDVYAQRINSVGSQQWAAGGVAIRVVPGAATFDAPAIISDGFGGAIVVWGDMRGGPYPDLYAQRVSGGGVAQWTANGVPVCTAANDQVEPAMVQDATGGAVISWTDGRAGGGYGIYAQRLSGAGTPQWMADGVALCPTTYIQDSPAMMADGAQGAVVVWSDFRSGGRDIYSQRVMGDGQAVSFTVKSTAAEYVTGTLWQAIVQANAILGPQVIRFDLPMGTQVIEAGYEGLPPITDPLTIDGFTQAGSSPNTNPLGSPSNAQIRIVITGSSLLPGLDFQASGTLRGVAISGFADQCVLVEAYGVVIEGNYIGTDASGLWNPYHQQTGGVRILGGNCRVGGTSPAARNVICNSFEDGIKIDGAFQAQVFGNYIGVGADAVSGLANWNGVHIVNGASGSHIGSSVLSPLLNPAEGNLIMFNARGVGVEGSTTTQHLIVGNSMLGNYIMSIDLGNDGFNPNDAGDVDTGPNDMQNSPELSSAVGSQITGIMNGTPNASFQLHFYWSPSCCLNATHYLGGAFVTTDGSGSAPFTFTPAVPIPPGTFINATATDVAYNNTSELAYYTIYMNTGSGSSQVATLMDLNGKEYGTATFTNVTSAGNTFTENPYSPPVPVSGYSIGNPNDPQIYFNITTNASYTGGVDVCLNYDENNIPGPEGNLVLLHYDGSMWVNVTTSRDPENHTICGRVTSLSPFVIGAVTTTAIDDTPLPTSFALHANVPNPFNPVTTIAYDIPQGGADVSIAIYDVAGHRVRDLVHEHRPAGTWSVQWNGEDDRGQRVASGVYFYRMRAGAFVDTRKMVLLK